jgi:polyisoprenoid-binding protein YceI
MSRTTVALIAIVSFLAGTVVGVLGYITVFAGSGEASRDIQDVAPTLDLGRALPAGDIMLMSDSTRNFAQPATTEEPDAPADDMSAEATPEATPVPLGEPISFARALYRINQENSLASFSIFEELQGQPVTVVGTTNQVGGDFIVDFADPNASQVGGIAINARTLVTDNEFRNRALRTAILRSAEDDYEFITFTPTSIEGLDVEGEIRENQAITFQIVGDLTIIETTNPVTFDASITIGTGGEMLTGSASTIVLYDDFNLTIPDVPGVANVGDEVTLAFDFSADLIETREAGDDAETDDSAETISEPITIARGLYRIDQTQSSVSFSIFEELQGQPVTVVGTTNQVAGDFIIDYGDATASQVGGIAINSRTLATDNEFRNRALRTAILRSAEDAYEFITFTPTSIEGLDTVSDINAGDSFTFTVTGDLTIIETTNPVTFDVTVTVTDADNISITASAIVLYADFNLTIPDVPGVANVGDEVTLDINAVATLVESR